MRKLIAILTLLCVSSMTMGALEYMSSAPGTMSEFIGDPSDITVLKVRGHVDASDLFFIGKNMPGLVSLDLGEAVVDGYSGAAVEGASKYAANTIPSKAFAGLPLKSLVLPASGRLVVGDAAFAGTSMESLAVPANVDSIGMGAFAGSPLLKEVRFSSPAALGDGAFAACPALVSVVLGGQNRLGAFAFADCTSLSDVAQSASLDNIGASAFAGCKSLDTFVFGKGLTIIGGSAFAGTSIKSADLSAVASLDSIGDWAFSKNGALTSVKFGGNVRAMGKGAFFDCPALEEFSLPESCETLADYVFKDDAEIKSDNIIHGRLKHIGDYAMKGHGKTADLVLPSTLRYIGSGAMEGMTGLKKISVSALDTVPELGENVWAGIDRPSVDLEMQPEMSDAFGAAEQWCDFHFVMDTGNIDAVVDNIPSASTLRGRFAGYNLYIESSSAEIETVRLYDASGLLLYSARCGSQKTVINTSAMTGNIFIADCTLDGGARGVVKLVRH